MKYERLTEKDRYWKDEEFWTQSQEPTVEEIDEIYNRLAELEDKIENGTLVELPFAIGQKIYCVIAKPRFVNEQYINEFEVGAYSVEKDRIDIIHYIEDDGIHRVYWTYESDNAFLTKAEAEKRLQELRGEL